jgi:hypothetical protein
MARLINYGTGDVCDRLTVLALKILHYGAAGKPTDYLEAERNALLAKVRAQELNGAWFEQVLELAAVNAALWAETDKLREYLALKEPDLRQAADAGYLGLSIMRLNDRRNQLVETINKLTGEHRGPEKG